jgi:uncharacterized membrane protein
MIDLEMGRLWWGRLRQTLWWRPTLWSAAAVATALASAVADAWVPADWLPPLPPDVVDDLLRIMATSMLAVSTFALSVLVNAYASAANAGTPRATRLVVAEPRSQKAVAAFLAAFIFSIVGVIALGVGGYGPAGRMLLFVSAVGVLAWVIVSFMSYLDIMSRLGRVSHTIETVERAAWPSLEAHARRPLAGARAADAPPDGARAIAANRTGHVQFIDIDALQKLARHHDGHVHVAVHAGDLVHPHAPLAWVTGGVPDDASDGDRDQRCDDKHGVDAMRDAFVIGSERTFEQDPAYGLIVLGEIAQRALSPAVNDPGTAIAVLGSQARLLIRALHTPPDDDPAPCDRVSAAPPEPAALVAIAFEPIARACAGQFDVMMQLLRHLDAVARNAPAPVIAAVRAVAQRALDRAGRTGADADDLSHWRTQARTLGL